MINQNNDQNDYPEIKIPPQRDLRDAQPTISVNYRVIKNMGENYSDENEVNPNDENYKDDWNKYEKEW